MKFRHHQQVTDDSLFLTDGGLETVLVFEKGIDLPEFASFTFLASEEGERVFREYLLPYIDLAHRLGTGFQLVDSGWRASSGWGEKLGLSENDLEKIIRKSGDLLQSFREEFETETSPMPVVGCIGPRGDGYRIDQKMTADEATHYHQKQIGTLADTRSDSVVAMTIGYSDEAIGILQSAKANEIPAVVSFTLETDGRLPSGESLGEAIESCDAATESYAGGFMINCAHPTHFHNSVGEGEWRNRICGVRANASKRSHEELDNSTELDRGNPSEFGDEVASLRGTFPHMRIFGGCCGTDFEHVSEMATALRG